jgi:hypothetical protein
MPGRLAQATAMDEKHGENCSGKQRRPDEHEEQRYCEIDFDTGCRLAKFFYTLGRINWQTHAAASTPLLASVQSVQPDRAQNALGIEPPRLSLYRRLGRA